MRPAGGGVRRLGLLIALLAGLVALAIPTGAFADGDPGSDELVYQTLFFGAQDNLSVGQQIQLSHLLDATTALHAPVRVAIIGRKADLGTVTYYWTKPPDQYAEYLGSELELAYSGRLVVVTPHGAAFFWFHKYGHGVENLPGIRSGSTPAQLVAAANAAVDEVEADTAGISPAKLADTAESPTVIKAAEAAASQSTSAAVASVAALPGGASPAHTTRASTRSVSPAVVVIVLILGFSAVFWVPALWRRRGSLATLRHAGIALPGLGLAVCLFGALVVLAVVIHSNDSAGVASAQATNPHLAAVDPLEPQVAPNFTLTDESGQKVSLKQYRGKVVILSFTDDECQTICPLTTQAMVDARDSLGAARKDVQLLGVDANAKSTSVEDVASYTQLHGMVGQWHFLTGTDTQLKKIWDEYGIADDLSSTSSIIEHTPAVWVIGPNGKAAATSVTYPSYSSIPQFGQELAQEAAKVLPSHPRVLTHYSYDLIKGISASTRTTLRTLNGGTVTLGTGKPHLYLFFTTWDSQSTPIAAKMKALNTYARQAKALGLPPLTAIDEASVEPNLATVKRFVAGLHLDYPVAVDATGQVADGYGVEGEPWFVLAVPRAHNTVANPTATTPFTQEVYTEGWPSLKSLEADIPAALKPPRVAGGAKAIAKELAGSPPVLASLHRQASELLGGGAAALLARLKTLKGYPVVVNIWASDCIPCQREFGFLASESAEDGTKVAFIGIDYDDASATAARGFLHRHHVSYPSYVIPDASVPSAVLKGGVEGTPTTVIFNAQGKPVHIQIGTYQSQQELDEQIRAYGLGASS